jgi:hypothetical protein
MLGRTHRHPAATGEPPETATDVELAKLPLFSCQVSRKLSLNPPPEMSDRFLGRRPQNVILEVLASIVQGS